MAKGGFPRMPGGGNMSNMIKQAQKMQQDMLRVQEELEQKTVDATVGGGSVTVVVPLHLEQVPVSVPVAEVVGFLVAA